MWLLMIHWWVRGAQKYSTPNENTENPGRVMQNDSVVFDVLEDSRGKGAQEGVFLKGHQEATGKPPVLIKPRAKGVKLAHEYVSLPWFPHLEPLSDHQIHRLKSPMRTGQGINWFEVSSRRLECTCSRYIVILMLQIQLTKFCAPRNKCCWIVPSLQKTHN